VFSPARDLTVVDDFALFPGLPINNVACSYMDCGDVAYYGSKDITFICMPVKIALLFEWILKTKKQQYDY